jgi:hypothetical protein
MPLFVLAPFPGDVDRAVKINAGAPIGCGNENLLNRRLGLAGSCSEA